MAFPVAVSKLREFPLVNSAMDTSCNVYHSVKDSSSVANRTLSSAEAILSVAAQMALPLLAQFSQPIESVDRKIASGLQTLEEKVPLVKQPPSEILERTKEAVAPCIETCVSTAASGASRVKERANAALRSPPGCVAMDTLDVTSELTDRAIDYCFPPREGEEEIHPHSNSYCEDKVYHVVHTVGTLGIKAGRKVCHAVTTRARQPDTSRPPPPYPSDEPPRPYTTQ